GGVVNVSVKSGTNEFRGSAYEFLRNESLDARNFFSPINQPKPHYVLNQFGGTLGGPIIRDKTFFFASYEGYRERQGQTLTSTVPTLAMRSGNFSGLGTIYDPLTTVQTGSTYTRQPFPGNIIPADRMDAPAAALIQWYPQPTTSGLANNFIWSPVRPQNIDQGDGRIDQQIGRGNLFGRYSYGHTTTVNPAYLPGKAQGAANFSGPNDLNTQGLAIGLTYTFTPALVSETRLGFTRLKRQVFPFFFGESLSQEVGISNAQQDMFSSGLTTISISGFRGLGNASFMPIYQVENSYQVTENLNLTHGRHILKVGGQIIRPQIEQFQSANPAGLFGFDANFTNNPAAPAGTGNAMASFLLGYPASTSRTAQLSPNYLRWIEVAGYLQDDWKILPNLTLNLGLRYEVNTPAVSANDQFTNFNFRTGKMDLAGIGGVSRSANIRTNYKGVAPRVGFAYSFTPKTVIRGGYGIFYDTVPMFANLRPFPYLTSYSIVNSAFNVTNRMSDGFPLNTWNIAQNAASPFGQVNAVPSDNPLSYVQQYNVTIQRSLAQNLGLTVAYVGTLGRRLRWVYDDDVPVPGPGAVQQRRPYYALAPNVTSILTNHAEASSTYHSLQVSLQKRFSNGLSFQTSYTYSHWIDNAVSEAGYGSGGPSPQDLNNRRADRGNDPADIRHRLVYSWIYELPFGSGKRWLNHDVWLPRIVGGWQVNGVLSIQSGLPFTVTLASAVTNTGTGNRANCIADAALPRDQRSLARFFNTSAFATPPLYQFGSCGRDTVYGPGFVNLDSSLFRTFRFHEKRSLQFHAEFFNLTNTPQFGLPSGSFGSSTFGTISSLASNANMRQIQFALKLLF
ncbi:MAG TPA: TonB-dependent receptor, partial [Bryobacteraceae bacterium]